jgi:anthranilate synthase component 1
MTMRIHPDIDEFRRRAVDGKGADLVPVHAELLADTLTPISAYLRLVGDRPGFLLESVEGGEKVGRYSFLGVDPDEIIVGGGGDPLDEIERRIGRIRCYHDAALPRFLGGAVGYIGYDCVDAFEPRLGDLFRSSPKPGLDLPRAAFFIARNLVVFDHLRRRALVIVNASIGADGPDAAYRRATARIGELVDRLRAPAAPAVMTGAKRKQAAEVTSNCRRDEFVAAVEKAKSYIAAGDAFQVVLSQRFQRPVSAAPFDVYRALRAVNPSPYMFYLNFPAKENMRAFTIAGSSPEVMVRLENGRITLRPIAGTRPRGRTPEEDFALEKELLADAKELAEHIMLVDLGRNDVGRVAAPGSVKVDELMCIERYSHVMHIVSNVTGELAKGSDAYDVIRAAFPAGTVSGAPKIRAMEIIHELEPTARVSYAGAVGYIGFDGNSDTAIVLRTIVMQDGIAYVQAGAGIVYDSVPDREFEETVNKARGMMAALEMADEEEWEAGQ